MGPEPQTRLKTSSLSSASHYPNPTIRREKRRNQNRAKNRLLGYRFLTSCDRRTLRDTYGITDYSLEMISRKSQKHLELPKRFLEPRHFLVVL